MSRRSPSPYVYLMTARGVHVASGPVRRILAGDYSKEADMQETIDKIKAEIEDLERQLARPFGGLFDKKQEDHLYHRLKKKRKELARLEGGPAVAVSQPVPVAAARPRPTPAAPMAKAAAPKPKSTATKKTGARGSKASMTKRTKAAAPKSKSSTSKTKSTRKPATKAKSSARSKAKSPAKRKK